MAGRPTIFTEAIANAICRRLADGESLRHICLDKRMPSRETVRRWQGENSLFRGQYVTARDHMVDALAEEAMFLAKTANPKNANARRLYVDTVKWYTGKVAPKKYGDKLAMEVTGKVTIGDAIEKGRERVKRLRGG